MGQYGRFIAVAMVLWAAPAWAQLCTLEWDANQEPDLAGYRVYTALSSQSYVAGSGAPTVQPTMTCDQLGLLADGRTHFFVVSATNVGGLESSGSNEVSILLALPPVDSDGDGVPDLQDQCPAQPGPFTNNGCPIAVPPPPDTDGDGIVDTLDACPAEPGPGTVNGCPVVLPPLPPPPPLDTDGDGFTDDVDACPTVAGPNNGCPVITPPPPPDERICLRVNPHGKCTKWSSR